jgi:GT2 family glycosyltransferase
MSVTSSPTVSVVMPTYNRLDQLRAALEGLAGQHDLGEPVEVIVVSDGSTDGTDDYLSSSAVPLPVVALTQPNAGPAAARNRGLEAARGGLVLFVDDDTVAAPDLVAAHLRRHTRPDDDLVVIGPMLTPADYAISPWVQWEQDMLTKQYEAMRTGVYEATARQFYTGNASVARSHLCAVGGFDTAFRRAEDVELAYRLADRGLRFAFDPTAIVHHYAERSFDSWLQAAYAYGRNDVVFGRDHGRAWLLQAIGREFHGRHALVRGLTGACLPRPRLGRAVLAVLSATARASGRAHVDRVARPMFSAVYNLAYYRGMADELGDARQLLQRFAGEDSSGAAAADDR